MTNITGFTFLSTDGKTQLHGMRWEPEGRSVRAVLQICHGVAEHIARYDAFARYLNELGIAVVGHDHLGHGRSLPEGGTPVYFGAGSTWHTVVDDIYVLHQRIRLWYPDVPLCIMGHSMGSFLTRTYLIRYPGTVKAAIIMGTGWQPKAVVAGGLAVARAAAAVVGESGTSDLVTQLAFGAYNKQFAPNRTSCDWLSADTDNVDAYMADPLCHGGAVPSDAAGHPVQPAAQQSAADGRPDAGAVHRRRQGPRGCQRRRRPSDVSGVPPRRYAGLHAEAVSRSAPRDPQ